MNTMSLAKSLHRCEYLNEVTPEVQAEAKANGLVIVFGASDDLMEFDGAIYDEVGCGDGSTVYLTPEGLLTNDCENDECPHFERLKGKAVTIEAVWDSEGYSWTYKTSIPHHTFDVLEGDDKYCRGIVFALKDVPITVEL